MKRKTKTITELKALPKPRLMPKDYAFFKTFADAIDIFKSHDLPGANCEGCIVSPMSDKGKRRILFVFAVAHGRTMEVGIDIDDLQNNPREYIESTLELINAAYKEAKKQFDTTIHVLSGNQLSDAVRAVNSAVH